jgi:hypothetical protein
LRQFELWWFGLGFIGVVLTIVLVERMGYARERKTSGLSNSLRVVSAVFAASWFGPLMLIGPAMAAFDPVAFRMMVDFAKRRPAERTRGQRAATLALGFSTVAFLVVTLVVEPATGH